MRRGSGARQCARASLTETAADAVLENQPTRPVGVLQVTSLALTARPSFNETDIRRCLPGEIEKGRGYLLRGAVRGLRAEEDGSRLIADVQGTRAAPYRVEIAIESSRKGVRLVGECSCPVGWNCKHCAAVLLQAIEQPPPGLAIQAPDPLAGPLAAWLAQLPSDAVEEAETVETLVYRLDRSRNAWQPFTLEARIVRPLKSGRRGGGRPGSPSRSRPGSCGH